MAIPTIFAKVQELDNKINILSAMPVKDSVDIGPITQRLTTIEDLLANTDTVNKIQSLESGIVQINEIVQTIEARIATIEHNLLSLPTTETIAQLVNRIDTLENTLSKANS